MAQLDKYLQHMLRFEATTLSLQSNGPVVAKLANGTERASTQTVDHAVLVATIQDAMPPEALSDVRSSRPTKFSYPTADPQVNIDVTPTPGLWRVTITPLPPSAKPARSVSERPRRPEPTTGILSLPPDPRAASAVMASTLGPPTPAGGSARASQLPSTALGPPQRPSSSFAPVDAMLGRSTPMGGSVAGVAAGASLRPSSSGAPTPGAGVERASLPPPTAPEPRAARSSDSIPAPPATLPPPPGFGGGAGVEVPSASYDSARIDALLRTLSKLGGSDLHLCVGRPPMARVHGSIKPLEGTWPTLTQELIMPLLYATMPVANRRELAERRDTDYAYELKGVARFRCNAYVDRSGNAAVMRRIPEEIVPFEQLGLPKSVSEFCNLSKGLVLVTGPTGSGKSTTLATLIDRINASRREHIITMEDPIEFVHQNKKCLVNQREIRVHTDSFKNALRAALREDPDVVLVGELRDLETIAMAIETAETGHLVFGTLHTRTAPSTVDRIIDQFPGERQGQIRTMLSESLRGVIAQTLCKKVGGGRVAAYEVLVVTPAVANLIREGKVFQIPGIMQTNRAIGMSTLTDSLCELVKSGKVEVKEAMAKAVSRAELRKALTEAGIRVPDRYANKE